MIAEEDRKVYQTLRANGYSMSECNKWWAPYRQSNTPSQEKKTYRGSIPYIPGVSDRIRSILKASDIHVGMKPSSTLKNLLVKKRPAPPTELGIVYQLPCSTDGCNWTYVGESSRSLPERKREHMRAVREMDVLRSEVAKHATECSHEIGFSEMKTIDKETNWRKRIVKESWWTKTLSSCNRTKHTISNFWFK